MAALNSTLYAGQVAGTIGIPAGVMAKGTPVFQQCVIAVPNTGAGTALNDTLGLFVIPRGATLRAFTLQTDRLDTGGPTLTIDAGYAGSTQALGAAWAGAATALVQGQPNVMRAPTTALGVQFTADTPIFATVHAAATTKAAGNLVANVEYTMDGLAS